MTEEKQLSLTAESGLLIELRSDGVALVDYPGNRSGRPVPARSCIPVERIAPMTSIILAFLDGDPEQPVILGVVQTGAPQATRIVAQDELVLECGSASIVLTSGGKILIRGDYIVSESRGVNQINGAAVKLN
jgi:hypothetical protein